MVRGGWAGQRWADTRGGQSRAQGLWSGLMEGSESGSGRPSFQPLQATLFCPWAGGLSHSPSRQRRPRGFGQACSTCILVPPLLHFANAHITQFPWRPASLREAGVEGPSERTRGNEQLGSGGG